MLIENQKFHEKILNYLQFVSQDVEFQEDLSKDFNLNFEDVYKLHRVLGAGGFGVVCEVTCVKTSRQIAIKICLHPTQASKQLEQEFQFLSKISHVNVIKVFEIRVWQNYIVMEMELAQQSLKQMLNESINEADGSVIMKGIFQALSHLHNEQNVIHRDIKPENIVFILRNDVTTVKLIDFGLAVKSDHSHDFPRCGTHLYTPPEQALNNFAYAKKADMWAAGIILYQMLIGEHPFKDYTENRDTLDQRLKQFEKIEFSTDVQITQQVKNLITSLCHRNISGRIGAIDCLKHPWITRNLNEQLPLTMQQKNTLDVRNYAIEDKLRKVISFTMFCSTQKQTSFQQDYKQILLRNIEEIADKTSDEVIEQGQKFKTDQSYQFGRISKTTNSQISFEARQIVVCTSSSSRQSNLFDSFALKDYEIYSQPEFLKVNENLLQVNNSQTEELQQQQNIFFRSRNFVKGECSSRKLSLNKTSSSLKPPLSQRMNSKISTAGTIKRAKRIIINERRNELNKSQTEQELSILTPISRFKQLDQILQKQISPGFAKKQEDLKFRKVNKRTISQKLRVLPIQSKENLF